MLVSIWKDDKKSQDEYIETVQSGDGDGGVMTDADQQFHDMVVENETNIKIMLKLRGATVYINVVQDCSSLTQTPESRLNTAQPTRFLTHQLTNLYNIFFSPQLFTHCSTLSIQISSASFKECKQIHQSPTL